MERARNELGSYLVEVVDSQAAKERYHISATPALIIVSDALQGANLLTETGDGQLRVTAELWAAIEREEAVIHDAATHRIDNVIKAETAATMADNAQVMDDMLTKLIESGAL